MAENSEQSTNAKVKKLWARLKNTVTTQYSSSYNQNNRRPSRAVPVGTVPYHQQPYYQQPYRQPPQVLPVRPQPFQPQLVQLPPVQLPPVNPADRDLRLKYYNSRMNKTKEVLTELHLPQLVENFRKQDIGVEDVNFLSDQDFAQLGVFVMGDKCRLKRKCQNLTEGEESKLFFRGEDNYEELVEERIAEPTSQQTEDVLSSLNEPSTSGVNRDRIQNGMLRESSMNITMAEQAKFELGDRDNVYTTEQHITADSIGTVGQTGQTDGLTSEDSALGSSTKDFTMNVRMEKNAHFEAGNKQNKVTSNIQIAASTIDNLTGGGSSTTGLPGINQLTGSAPINIVMGDNAALHGLESLSTIDLDKLTLKYVMVDVVSYNEKQIKKRKVDRFPKKLKTKHRLQIQSEFSKEFWNGLVRFYNKTTTRKSHALRIKQTKPNQETYYEREEWVMLNQKAMEIAMEVVLKEFNDVVNDLNTILESELSNTITRPVPPTNTELVQPVPPPKPKAVTWIIELFSSKTCKQIARRQSIMSLSENRNNRVRRYSKDGTQQNYIQKNKEAIKIQRGNRGIWR